MGMGQATVDNKDGSLHTGKYPSPGKLLYVKTVPAVYLHADDEGDYGTSAVTSHTTKNLGLVAAHVARSALERDDADADLKELPCSPHHHHSSPYSNPRPCPCPKEARNQI